MRPNGTGPQVLDFEAVIWGPKPDQIREPHPLKGDTVGAALAINDTGVAVGMTGNCSSTEIPLFSAAAHAVLWERDGTVHNLGNLGGTRNPAETGMHDLGVLPGDFVGAGIGINNKGEIVGASISSPGPSSGNPRAYLWRSGVMRDLNTLIPQDSPLYLLTAFAINDWGQITGFGVQLSTGDLHGFLLTPCDLVHVVTAWCTNNTDDAVTEAGEGVVRPAVVLSQSAREQLQQRLPLGPLGAQLMAH